MAEIPVIQDFSGVRTNLRWGKQLWHVSGRGLICPPMLYSMHADMRETDILLWLLFRLVSLLIPYLAQLN